MSSSSASCVRISRWFSATRPGNHEKGPAREGCLEGPALGKESPSCGIRGTECIDQKA
jgi:hypothetical protein